MIHTTANNKRHNHSLSKRMFAGFVAATCARGSFVVGLTTPKGSIRQCGERMPVLRSQRYVSTTIPTTTRLFSNKVKKANNENTTKRILSPRQTILNRFDTNNNHHSNSNDNEYNAKRQALLDTLDWLEHVVIGYNLCPFAEAPMRSDDLDISVVLGTDERTILSEVLGECQRLARQPGTALVVCPDCNPTNFLKFLETYTVLVEGLLPDHELDQDVQIAPFHPLFVFENDDADVTDNTNTVDAIDNYTNRSPYPMFHVLREVEVEKAVQALDGNAETVWKRNVDLLEAMEDIFHSEDNDTTMDHNPDNDTLLRSVFLKGTADRVGSDATNCPAKQQIEDYQKKIRGLLREFRKREY